MRSSQQLKKPHIQSKFDPSSTQGNRIKQNSHLQMYKTAYQQLQHSFKNNLNVIKQLQQENTLLQQHLTQFQLQYQRRLQMQMKESQEKHQQQMMKQQINFGRQVQLIKKQYEDFISTINQNMENQSQQVVKALIKKHKVEVKQVSASYQRQIQQLFGQVKKLQKHNTQLQESVTKAQAQVNSGQLKLITLQTELQKAQKQKQQTQTLYTGYQQQLQTLKQSNNSWEDMLKQRIRQLQQQKCSLEQEMTESKFLHKEKQKKLAQQHNKKIMQLEQAYSMKMNDVLRESKEIRFRFEKIKEENIELKGQVDKSKRELTQTLKQLQAQQSKYVTAQDSMLLIKEKEYQLSSAQEEIKRLKNEKVTVQQQEKQIKEQLSKVNYQRQTAEKALQRVKVQLLNKSKQVEELRKQLSKVKYNQQVNYNSGKHYVPQQKGVKEINGQNKRSHEQQQQQLQGGIDYSQCFTQDMGPIDENFFLPNSSIGRQPQASRQYRKIQQQYEESTPRGKEQSGQKETIAQLMKRIAQLQVQGDQYKAVIKTIKEEMQRTAYVMDDKLSLKDREIKLGKQQNMMLRERLNSKQEQIIEMKQNIQKHKQQQTSYEDVIKQKLQIAKSIEQNRKITEENKILLQKVHELQQQVQYLKRERETLEEIADQLKTEVEELKEELRELNEIGEEKNYRGINGGREHLQYHTVQDNSRQSYQSYQHSIKQHVNHHKPLHQNNFIPTKQQQYQSANQYKSNNHQQPRSKSKSPKQHLNQQNTKTKESFASKPTGVKRKLHELIKQKNTLQMQNTPIIGRKANLQKRSEQERTEHVGTMSQKQIYQRLERVSKSRSKQKLSTKFKDYQIPQSLALNSKQSFNKEKQLQVQPSQPQHESQQDEQLQHDEFNKRIEMMNRMREEMKNDSLGQFDQLQNVSLTYWEQQV